MSGAPGLQQALHKLSHVAPAPFNRQNVSQRVPRRTTPAAGLQIMDRGAVFQHNGW